MRFFRRSFRKSHVPCILAFAALFLAAGGILGSNAEGMNLGARKEFAPESRSDKAIFQKPIASDQLTFLNNFAGQASNDVVRDGKCRKLIHTVVPDTPFHYGTDMPLSDAIENVLSGPPLPVESAMEICDGLQPGGPDVRGRDKGELTCRMASPWAGSFTIQQMENPHRRSQFFPSR